MHRVRLTIRNETGTRAWVSLDPWRAYETLDSGDWITVSCEVPDLEWLSLDFTGTHAVFLNGSRGADCSYEVATSLGDVRREHPALTERPADEEAKPPEPYATWAKQLDPSSWRAVLHTELPLTVNGQRRFDMTVRPEDARPFLATSRGPDDGSVMVTLFPDQVAIASRTSLELEALL